MARPPRYFSVSSQKASRALHCFLGDRVYLRAMARVGGPMPRLAETIAQRKVNPGQLAVYWLGQAGFAFKSSSNEVVYIDPYFSDVVERLVGFKRMMPCPVLAEDADANLLV